MVRTEFIVVGCILAFIGFILCIQGYNKLQPTLMDNIVSFTEALSGKPAPAELKSTKDEGYAFLFLGVVALGVGIGFIIKSRK